MRKYNLVLLFILILITISVSSYFFYLDIMYEDKLVKKDVESLYKLKRAAGRPIAVFATKKELATKVDLYNQIIVELNIDAIAKVQSNIIIIEGEIHNGFSYVLLKRLLNIIKNDEVNVISACIGKQCSAADYGFLLKIRPYTLKLK